MILLVIVGGIILLLISFVIGVFVGANLVKKESDKYRKWWMDLLDDKIEDKPQRKSLF